MGEITLSDYFRQQGASSDAIQYLCSGFESDSVLEWVHELATVSGPILWKIRGGNDRLPLAMAEVLRENIRYGAVVVRIVQKADKVEIAYLNAGSHHSMDADHVICTLPFSVLRGIDVEPRWSPNKESAIQNLYMGAVARVYAQTKSRFWESDGRNGFASVDQAMDIWSPTFDDPGKRGIVMSYIYEDLAVRYSNMSEEAQIQRSLDVFEQIHPGIRDHFEGGTTWSWQNHPYSKGAYMITRPEEFRTVMPYVSMPEGRVHFAGDHTSPWPGWIQGALHSGLRAAREVTNSSQ